MEILHAVIPRIKVSPDAVLVPKNIATLMRSQAKQKKKLLQLHSCTTYLKANIHIKSY